MKRSPIRKRRAKPRPGRMKGKALERLRREVFELCGGVCQLNKSSKCLGWVGWDYGHMHHVIHRSLGGKDDLSNLVWACGPCHWAEHNPKACPPKPVTQLSSEEHL